jgi:hypothetical protein
MNRDDIVLTMPVVCAYCILLVTQPGANVVAHVQSLMPQVVDGTEISAVELHAGEGDLIVFRAGHAEDLTGRLGPEEFMCLAPIVGRIGWFEVKGRRVAPSLITYWRGTAVCGMHLLMVSATAPMDASSLSDTLRGD